MWQAELRLGWVVWKLSGSDVRRSARRGSVWTGAGTGESGEARLSLRWRKGWIDTSAYYCSGHSINWLVKADGSTDFVVFASLCGLLCPRPDLSISLAGSGSSLRASAFPPNYNNLDLHTLAPRSTHHCII